MTARVERGMVWTTAEPVSSELVKAGYTVFDFARLVRDYIEPVEMMGLQHKTLLHAEMTTPGFGRPAKRSPVNSHPNVQPEIVQLQAGETISLAECNGHEAWVYKQCAVR